MWICDLYRLIIGSLRNKFLQKNCGATKIKIKPLFAPQLIAPSMKNRKIIGFPQKIGKFFVICIGTVPKGYPNRQKIFDRKTFTLTQEPKQL